MPHRTFVLRLVALLGLLATASVAAASPATHGRVRPTNRVYKTHQGWEYRTEHFITLATTAGEDAQWAGDELEAAWQETARLADHFGTAHRKQDLGMVGAIVARTPLPLPATQTRFPQVDLPTDSTVVQIALGTTPNERDDARLALRQGAAKTLLRQSGYLQKLPPWVADGLAQFVAEEAWSDEQVATARAQRMLRPGEPPSWAVVFRYLMTADDGARSATFLATYGDDEQFRLRRQTPPHRRWDLDVAEDAATFSKQSGAPSIPGISEAELIHGVDKWLANPHAGEPRLSVSEGINGPTAQRAQEMALLVKLWDRTMAKDNSPATTAQGATPTGIELTQLHRALTSQSGPPWSTLDAGGRLLTWRDRDEIDALFADANRGYRSIVKDGKPALEWRAGDGTVLEAWIDRDAKNGPQPIIHVQSNRAAGKF